MNELGTCEQDMYEQGMNELGRLENLSGDMEKNPYRPPIILKIQQHMIARFAVGRNFEGVFALNLPLICRKKHLLT